MKRVIFWRLKNGSVARECVAYLPERLIEFQAVFYKPGEVITAAVESEDGEVIEPEVVATGKEIKVPAVMRDETPEEVFSRWLTGAQQREQDKHTAYAAAVAEGRVPTAEQLAAVDVAATRQAKLTMLRVLWAQFPEWGAGDGMEFAGVYDGADDLPACHEHYFDALEWDGVGQRPKPNLTKSRNLKLNWLRVERNSELEKLDREQMRAIGNPTELAAVEAKKQRLRDMPVLIAPTMDACADLTALDAVTLAQFKVEHGV